MPYTKTTWVEGTTAITAPRLNNLETQYDEVKAIAQMMKITTDTGGVAISVASTGNLLDSIVSAGVGLRTFYAAGGAGGLPGSISVRGISHFTSANYGWVFAYDYNNNFYTNYMDNGTWKGWEPLVTATTLNSDFAKITQPSWINATYKNSWGTLDSSPLRYRKNTLGDVFVEGSLTGGSTSDGTVLCTLPVGYRPQRNQHCLVPGYTTDTTPKKPEIVVKTTGDVILNDGLYVAYLHLWLPPFKAYQ